MDNRVLGGKTHTKDFSLASDQFVHLSTALTGQRLDRTKRTVHLATTGTKRTVHLDTTGTKCTVHLDTTGTKCTVHLDTTGTKRTVHLDTTGIKRTVHLDTTGTKCTVHLDTTGTKRTVHLDTTGIKRTVHLDTTGHHTVAKLATIAMKPRSYGKYLSGLNKIDINDRDKRCNSRFLQFLYCARICFQHVHSSGNGTVVCRLRATHPAFITCNMLFAMWYKGTTQLLSLTELKSHLFQLYFIA